MKKIIALSFVFALAVSSVSFAQYGGGNGWTYFGPLGGNGPVLSMDNCPNGDLSASFYDSSCGTVVGPNQVASGWLLTTGPSENVTKKVKKMRRRMIKFINSLMNLPILNALRN